MSRTFTWDSLEPAAKPTFYFIGVTTGSSSIRKVFPLWAEHLGLGDVEMVGIDLALHAPAEHYRAVVQFLKADPLSLGALVTTHKLDLYSAARDLFDEVDPLADLMDEVSCLSKRDGRFRAHAKDPITAGHALDAFVPAGYFQTNPQAEVLVFGAGGSAIAIDWYLTRPERGANRPSRIVVTNRSRPRLQTLRAVHEASGTDTELVTRLCPTAHDNDAALAAAPGGSLVINATGLGKDAPGSPVTFDGRFPERGIVWELNYRGELVFLEQARGQQAAAALTVVDGWVYFIHGWTQVIAEVFDVDIPASGPAFDELAAIAESTR